MTRKIQSFRSTCGRFRKGKKAFNKSYRGKSGQGEPQWIWGPRGTHKQFVRALNYWHNIILAF